MPHSGITLSIHSRETGVVFRNSIGRKALLCNEDQFFFSMRLVLDIEIKFGF